MSGVRSDLGLAHVKAEGKAGRMGQQLMAVVAEGHRGRKYLEAPREHVAVASRASASPGTTSLARVRETTVSPRRCRRPRTPPCASSPSPSSSRKGPARYAFSSARRCPKPGIPATAMPTSGRWLNTSYKPSSGAREAPPLVTQEARIGQGGGGPPARVPPLPDLRPQEARRGSFAYNALSQSWERVIELSHHEEDRALF